VMGLRRLPTWALLSAGAGALWPSTGLADVKACIDAALDGQKLRDAGAYRRAREQFIACAADPCPGEVRKGCVGWLAEVEKLMPTVVFGARAHGKEVADVRVAVDGEAVVERIDGKPIVLDPGEHHFRFERAGEVPIDETAVLRAGEKERPIGAQFGTESSIQPSRSLRPPSLNEARPPPALKEPTARTAAYALAALGFASLAAGAALDISGYVFLQQCGGDPSCSGNHERAEVMWRFVTGDVLLGVGALSCVVAWLFWWRGGRVAAYRPVTLIGGESLRGPRSVVLTVAF
jgi:hypothetical protein